MEPDTCPPYWPSLVWWLIHHRRIPDPDPGPIDRERFAQLDAHFAAIAVASLSNRLADREIGGEVGKLAGALASDPMPGFGQLASASAR